MLPSLPESPAQVSPLPVRDPVSESALDRAERVENARLGRGITLAGGGLAAAGLLTVAADRVSFLVLAGEHADDWRERNRLAFRVRRHDDAFAIPEIALFSGAFLCLLVGAPAEAEARRAGPTPPGVWYWRAGALAVPAGVGLYFAGARIHSPSWQNDCGSGCPPEDPAHAFAREALVYSGVGLTAAGFAAITLVQPTANMLAGPPTDGHGNLSFFITPNGAGIAGTF